MLLYVPLSAVSGKIWGWGNEPGETERIPGRRYKEEPDHPELAAGKIPGRGVYEWIANAPGSILIIMITNKKNAINSRRENRKTRRSVMGAFVFIILCQSASCSSADIYQWSSERSLPAIGRTSSPGIRKRFWKK